MTAASVTNIVLDCIAVFVLDWGIAGAAIATVISQCLASLICWVKMKQTPALQFDRSNLVPDKVISRNLIALGAPITLKIAIIALGGMIIQSVVNSFDMAFIAGFTASNKLFGLLELPPCPMALPSPPMWAKITVPVSMTAFLKASRKVWCCP